MFKKGMLTALMLLMTVICFGCNADENPAREFANSHSSSENASELETISPTIRGQNEEITKVVIATLGADAGIVGAAFLS